MRAEEPYVLISNSLGQLYARNGDYQKAIELYEDALPRIVSAYGSNFIGVAAISNSLGQVYLSQNNFGDAEAMFEKALSILNDNDAAKPIVLNNLGEAYRLQRKYEAAKTYYDLATAAFEALYGRESS